VTSSVSEHCRDNQGRRDGIGVFRLTRKTRKINTIHPGFIDYGGR
jgi:hypothetical protein